MIPKHDNLIAVSYTHLDVYKRQAVEMAKQVTLTAPQVRAYLYSLRQGDKNDENIKRGIINIFLRAVYLYDDRFTLVLNGSDTPITIDDILLDEIEEGLEGDLTNCEGCSSLVAGAPPRRSKRYIACSDLFYKSEQAHSAAPPFQIEPAVLGFDLVLSADLNVVTSILF